MSKIFDDSWIKKSHESTPQDWFSIVTTPALNTPVLQTRKKKRNHFFQRSASKHTTKTSFCLVFFRKKCNYYGIVRVLLLFLLLHPIHFFTPCFACALLRRVWGTPKFSISEDLQMCDLVDFGIRDSHPWGSNYITPTQALCTNSWANHSKITIDLHTFFDSSNS